MATGVQLPGKAKSYVKIADRPEPPKCPYNNLVPDRRHPGGRNSRTCPICYTRNVWVSAQRRKRIADGEHVPNRHSNRGRPADPELRKPVPKCGRRHPPRDGRRRADCDRCTARKHYVAALLRDARAEGRDMVVLVDNDEAADARQKSISNNT